MTSYPYRTEPDLCPNCEHHHLAADATAIGRFQPGGPDGYRARYAGAPLRATRTEAVQDMCLHRRAHQPRFWASLWEPEA